MTWHMILKASYAKNYEILNAIWYLVWTFCQEVWYAGFSWILKDHYKLYGHKQWFQYSVEWIQTILEVCYSPEYISILISYIISCVIKVYLMWYYCDYLQIVAARTDCNISQDLTMLQMLPSFHPLHLTQWGPCWLPTLDSSPCYRWGSCMVREPE